MVYGNMKMLEELKNIREDIVSKYTRINIVQNNHYQVLSLNYLLN